MAYYFLLFIIVLLLSLIVRGKKKNETGTLLFITILLFLFFGLREGFTLDYDSYLSDFTGGNISDRHEGETLYKAMTEIFTYRFALIFQAILFCVLFFISFKNYINKEYWWLGFTILFLNIDFLIGFFSGFRSSFVTIAVFLAILVKNKIPNKWIGIAVGGLLIYASSLVHYSGLFMLPIVLLPTNRVGESSMRVVKIVSTISIIIFLFAASVFTDFVTMYLQTYSDESLYYIEDNTVDNYFFSIYTIISLAAKAYMLFYTLSYMSRKAKDEDTMVLGVTSLFFFISLMPNFGLISRLSYYTMFPTIIGISLMVKNENKIEKRLLFLGCLTIYLFLKYRNFILGGYNTLTHYDNIIF